MVPTMGTIVLGALGDWEELENARPQSNPAGAQEARGRNDAEEGRTYRQRKRARKEAKKEELQRVNQPGGSTSGSTNSTGCPMPGMSTERPWNVTAEVGMQKGWNANAGSKKRHREGP